MKLTARELNMLTLAAVRCGQANPDGNADVRACDRLARLGYLTPWDDVDGWGTAYKLTPAGRARVRAACRGSE